MKKVAAGRDFGRDTFKDLTAVKLVREPWWEDGGVLAFDFESDLADDVVRRLRARVSAESEAEDQTLQGALRAVTVNEDFLALTSPTLQQTAAQVQALTRQMNAVIRLVTGHGE